MGCASTQRSGALPMPRSSFGSGSAEILGPEQQRLAPFQDAARQPLGAERRVVDAAPVGGAGLHGHEAIGVVEQVDDADLRVGQPHERLQAAGGQGLDVERLELAHELGVRARPLVAAARSALARVSSATARSRSASVERRLESLSSRSASILPEARRHARPARRAGPASAGSGSSAPVASSASSSWRVVPATSRAIQAPLPRASTIATQQHGERQAPRGVGQREGLLLAARRRRPGRACAAR